jgi:hypothetical protein
VVEVESEVEVEIDVAVGVVVGVVDAVAPAETSPRTVAPSSLFVAVEVAADSD